MTNKKTIAICHYRIGKTDGVSLEIRKRKKALERLGYRAILISGPIQLDGDYNIPLLEFDRVDIQKIRHNAFEKFEDFKNDDEFEEYINKITNNIKTEFLKIHKKEKIEYLFIHNIFTHGRHIASAKAFLEIAEETNIKVISVNHDFYWVGSYKEIYKPTTNFVKKFLKKYCPPHLDKITHVTINSINKKALEEKISQKTILLPDTFDFEQKPWVKDKYNQDFLKKIGAKKDDLVVLQATRISKRKGIELALDFVAKLSENQKFLVGKKLYNDKVVKMSSKIVFVLAGYAEKDSLEYKNQLQKRAKEKNIKAIFISEIIDAERKQQRDKKGYSLWDSYVYADIVTFPSVWEGWGNQFIEAVYAKKPIVVFEYPVFKADIAKEGYKVITLGDKIVNNNNTNLIEVPQSNLNNAVKSVIRIITDPKTPAVLNKNFKLGKKYHSEKILETKLLEILKVADKKTR